MSAVLIWRPEPMTARLVAAQVPAREQWARAAGVRCVSNRVAGSIRVLGDKVVALDPLGNILEHGARPHTIEPRKKKALKFADGGFASAVQHPGEAAQPFMRPTLPLWAPLYRKTAAGAVRGL